MKVLAYKSQYGSDTITPLDAKLKNVGTVFSTHVAGSRLEMHVKQRLDTLFFAYTPTSINHPGTTAPESISHLLCKKAIASLANQGVETKLFLTRNMEHLPPEPIRFLRGDNECTFQIEGKTYRVDALCEFTSSNPDNELLSLSTKWSGKVAFEIFHTHKLASNSEKVHAEPTRVFRRQFILSHATLADSSNWR